MIALELKKLLNCFLKTSIFELQRKNYMPSELFAFQEKLMIDTFLMKCMFLLFTRVLSRQGINQKWNFRSHEWKKKSVKIWSVFCLNCVNLLREYTNKFLIQRIFLKKKKKILNSVHCNRPFDRGKTKHLMSQKWSVRTFLYDQKNFRFTSCLNHEGKDVYEDKPY